MGAGDKNMKGGGLTGKTIAAMAWLAAGTGSNFVLRIGTIAVVARLLSPEDFGVIAAGLVVLSFATSLNGLGLRQSLVQKKDLELEHIRSATTATVVFGLILSSVVALGAPAIASLYGVSELVWLLPMIAPILFLRSVMDVPMALIEREHRFRVVAINRVAGRVAYSVTAISCALSGWGVMALVWANIAQAGAEAGLYFILHPRRHWPGFSFAALKPLARFGLGLTAIQIVSTFSRQGDYIVVGRVLGADALGNYSRAYELMSAPVKIFNLALGKVLFAGMAQIQDQDERIRRGMWRGIALLALTVLPFSCWMALCAPEVILLLLGDQWGDAVAPFRVLALATYLRLSHRVASAVPRAKGVLGGLFRRHLIYASLVLGGAYLGASTLGMVGVAWGVLFALTVHTTLLMTMAIQLTGGTLREFGGAQLPGALTTVATSAVTLGISGAGRGASWDPILILIAAAAGAAATMALVWGVAPSVFLGPRGLWWLEFFRKRTRKRGRKKSEG